MGPHADDAPRARPRRRGFAVWNIEYRRVGQEGGGWPGTLEDAAAAVDHLAGLDGVDTGRVVTVGHSAGGHLAVWLAARHRLPAGAPGARPRAPARGRLPGGCRRPRARRRGRSRGRCVRGAARRERGRGPRPLRRCLARCASAARRFPSCSSTAAVTSTCPLAQSRAYAGAARAAGDEVELVELAGRRSLRRGRGRPSRPGSQSSSGCPGSSIRAFRP